MSGSHGSHERARLSLFTLLNDLHCVDNMHLNFIWLPPFQQRWLVSYN